MHRRSRNRQFWSLTRGLFPLFQHRSPGISERVGRRGQRRKVHQVGNPRPPTKRRPKQNSPAWDTSRREFQRAVDRQAAPPSPRLHEPAAGDANGRQRLARSYPRRSRPEPCTLRASSWPQSRPQDLNTHRNQLRNNSSKAWHPHGNAAGFRLGLGSPRRRQFSPLPRATRHRSRRPVERRDTDGRKWRWPQNRWSSEQRLGNRPRSLVLRNRLPRSPDRAKRAPQNRVHPCTHNRQPSRSPATDDRLGNPMKKSPIRIARRRPR